MKSAAPSKILLDANTPFILIWTSLAAWTILGAVMRKHDPLAIGALSLGIALLGTASVRYWYLSKRKPFVRWNDVLREDVLGAQNPFAIAAVIMPIGLMMLGVAIFFRGADASWRIYGGIETVAATLSICCLGILDRMAAFRDFRGREIDLWRGVLEQTKTKALAAPAAAQFDWRPAARRMVKLELLEETATCALGITRKGEAALENGELENLQKNRKQRIQARTRRLYTALEWSPRVLIAVLVIADLIEDIGPGKSAQEAFRNLFLQISLLVLVGISCRGSKSETTDKETQ